MGALGEDHGNGLAVHVDVVLLVGLVLVVGLEVAGILHIEVGLVAVGGHAAIDEYSVQNAVIGAVDGPELHIVGAVAVAVVRHVLEASVESLLVHIHKGSLLVHDVGGAVRLDVGGVVVDGHSPGASILSLVLGVLVAVGAGTGSVHIHDLTQGVDAVVLSVGKDVAGQQDK